MSALPRPFTAIATYFDALGVPGRKVRRARQWVVRRAVSIMASGEVVTA